MNALLVLLLAAASFFPRLAAAESESAGKPLPVTSKAALFDDPNFFPIAVWLQQPRNAPKFKAAGINMYVGLWNGPTEAQLKELAKADMPVICHQNNLALTSEHNAIVAAWMHDDEPDNAQSLGKGKGYGPPVLPSEIEAGYRRMRTADPTRPVLLNLGQGVAWDNWIGRGVRRNKPEDYPEYIKGADIVSFDIYPVAHDRPEVQGKLEYVARGVKRLVEWSGGRKTIWNCVECTHISNPAHKANPDQIRAQVWMAIVHGSRGLIYFVHEFQPAFKEAALLEDPENLAAVTQINKEITQLAPVLNSPHPAEKVAVSTDGFEIASLTKEHGGSIYVFAVAMENRGGRARFSGAHLSKSGFVEAIGGNRRIELSQGGFSDDFKGYGVSLYRIAR
jgi:hypothetical protein